MYNFKLNKKEDCFYIRQKVFVEEQGFHNEFDDIDNICTHISLYSNDNVIGCARVFEEEGKLIVGRIALLKEVRGLGLGTKILEYVHKYAKENNYKETHLHAQCRACKFYESLGYISYGPIELDEHVEHIWMKKEIK